MERFDVILVGGGPASRILNKYIKMANKEIKTAVFRDEGRIVNHCGTPYIVEKVIPWEKGLIKEELVTRFGTPIIVDRVIDGNTEEKYVVTESGKKYGYGKLVFATGTDQFIPPIEGKDLKNILKIRKTKDVKESIKLLETINDIVVLGAGFIGLEFAISLKNMGKNVTLIELAPHVMGNRLDEGFISDVEAHLKGLGINLMLGAKAVKFGGTDTVEYVELEDGTIVNTQAVLSAAGVKPIVDYAEKFGLTVTSQGIVVNEYFETGVPDVYAIGDCTETKSYITGKPIPGKLGSNAGQMARLLGLNFRGVKKPYEGVINAAITHLHGLSIASAGLSEKDTKENGIKTIISYGDSFSIYANMPGTEKVKIKMIYEKDSLKLLGTEIIGKFNPAGFIEATAQLIYMKADLYDVIGSHYSSHPELTPKTSHSYMVFASESALKQL